MNAQSSRVEAIMLSLKDEKQAKNLSRFFKTGPGQYGEGDLFLGIKVPQTRLVAKEEWRRCELSDVKELLRSKYHEIRLCALLILVKMYKHNAKDEPAKKAIVDFYIENTEGINNWDLVDLSCYEILGDWCITHDRDILYSLAREGKTIWEQRIGIVSCMALLRKGEIGDCFAIADILLHHSHDLIHKAVGWLLREAGKRDAQALKDFLCARISDMPRTTLRYAIEKFPQEERLAFLKK